MLSFTDLLNVKLLQNRFVLLYRRFWRMWKFVKIIVYWIVQSSLSWKVNFKTKFVYILAMCKSYSQIPAYCYVKFYAIWCIVIGGLHILHATYAIFYEFEKKRHFLNSIVFTIIHLIFSITYVSAGIVLLISIFKVR